MTPRMNRAEAWVLRWLGAIPAVLLWWLRTRLGR